MRLSEEECSLKRERVSNNVIRRLPMYLRKLDELMELGVDRISSSELGKQMGFTPSQIRQDFSCFGEFGQQGYGYRVADLREEVARILGMNEHFTAVVIGVGNLGHALIQNMRFAELGFNITAAFDASPDKIGSVISDIRIQDSSKLTDWLRDNPTDIAVLTVPQSVAGQVAKAAAECGVKGIWNFTNIDLDVGNMDVFVENIHFSDSLLALSYFINDRRRNGGEV